MDKSQDKTERIRVLYGLFTEAKATEAELTEFFALANELENEAIFRELFAGTWNELQKADPRKSQRPPVRRITVFSRWVAAAVLLILISGTYFLLNQRSGTEQAFLSQTKKPADIAPGGNKAILYLAKGKKIVLDSTRSGKLAVQGNSQVSKTDSGGLVYQSMGNLSGPEIIYNTLSTPRGGQFQLTLPDGSKVWLNAASSITYPTTFNGLVRNVSVTGEVYFEVAKNASHPFLVSLPSLTKDQGENSHWMQVEVLGTHFNINAYPDAAFTRTTLLEGSVQVDTWDDRVVIKPGEQALARLTTKKMIVDQHPDLEKVMAWKNGQISLTNSSVKEIMEEISRWYDVDVHYGGIIPDKEFYGSIDRNVPLSSVLNALKAYGVDTKLEGKSIIVQ